MKRLTYILKSIFLILCISCSGSKNVLEEIHPTHSIIPCYYTEYPQIIDLPDSFNFKKQNYYGLLYFTGYFDTLGNLIELVPQQLYIKNMFTQLVEKKYTFWNGWEDSSKNITKAEAMRYVIWAQKELPLITKLKRFPLNWKCNEPVSNRIGKNLEYALE